MYTTTRGRPKTKLLALGLTSLAIVSLTAGTMMSMALFTDQETDDSTFTTGTIVLDAAKVDAMDLTSSAMMPGDTSTLGRLGWSVVGLDVGGHRQSGQRAHASAGLPAGC